MDRVGAASIGAFPNTLSTTIVCQWENATFHCNFSVQEGPESTLDEPGLDRKRGGAELQSPWIASFCAKIAVKSHNSPRLT